MTVARERIARLEKELEEARREMIKEDAQRYAVLWREIPDAEQERILAGLTDKQERVLFGLEAPDETKRGGTRRSGEGGGDQTCTYCGKSGLTKRGLALHIIRLHKAEKGKEEETRI